MRSSILLTSFTLPIRGITALGCWEEWDTSLFEIEFRTYTFCPLKPFGSCKLFDFSLFWCPSYSTTATVSAVVSVGTDVVRTNESSTDTGVFELLTECSVSWTSSESPHATRGWLIAGSVTRLTDDIDVPIPSSTETPWIESRLLKTFNSAFWLSIFASWRVISVLNCKKSCDIWRHSWRLLFAWFRCVTRE